MVRHISSRRALLAGLVFFVLVVGGSLIYRWHVHRTTEAALAETQRNVQRLKNDRAARTAQDSVETPPVDLEHSETNVETDDAQAMSHDTQVPSTDETSEALDTADASLPDDLVSAEDAPAEDVPVSPFGFGPYPEVPADYFGVPIWIQDPGKISDFPDEATKNIELIDRVLVKLWQQGDRGIVGGSTRNGKIYPHYENIVYVKWTDNVLPNGDTYRFPSRMLTGADEHFTSEDIIRGNIPSNLTIIEFDDAGYDPYQFLNLEDKGY